MGTAIMDVSAGVVLGLFSWIAYRQLSVIDPFQTRGGTGLVVFALAGAVIYASRGRAVLWAIAGSLAFMIILVAYTPIIRSPTQRLIRSDSLMKADAVIALSSSVSDDQLLDQQGADRMLTAMHLVKTGVAANLVITSVSATGSAGINSSFKDQDRLYDLVGLKAPLIRTPVVANTREEALAAAKIARSNGWRRVAVVTSPTHTRRACAAFETAGLEVVCVPAISRDIAIGTIGGPADRLRAFQLWLYETLATDEYQRRGWIPTTQPSEGAAGN